MCLQKSRKKGNNMEYVKSPLNYVGGKYKLLPQLIPLFPKNIECFMDMFGGGFNVGINVECKSIVYNDSCEQLVKLFNYWKINSLDYLLREIECIIEEYKLSKENQEGYNNLRE